MTVSTLYRIAAVLLGLFAVGHTLGFTRFKPPDRSNGELEDATARRTDTTARCKATMTRRLGN